MFERKDIYQQITNSIIQQLENGVRPWLRPWLTNGLPQKTARLRRGGSRLQVLAPLLCSKQRARVAFRAKSVAADEPNTLHAGFYGGLRSCLPEPQRQ